MPITPPGHRSRTTRVRRGAGSHSSARLLLALALVPAASLATRPTLDAHAAPGPRPDFQLPFPCGEHWRLDNWGSRHAPALDMVRAPQQRGTEGSVLVASANGTVVQSFRAHDAGNMIQIAHGGGGFTTYLHLQSRSVSAGQRVARGQQIGRVGKDGPTANRRPHLHYELAVDTNGDQRASWGHAGSERVPAWFAGIQYNAPAGTTWSDVTSGNCTPPAPPPRPAENVRVYANVQTGLCLDSNARGRGYTLTCNGGSFQKWYALAVSATDVTLTNAATRRCLDSNAKGRAYTLACNGGPFQRWEVTINADTTRTFRNRATRRCLDSNAAGTLYTLACNGGRYQRWRLR